jgi:Immunity protein 50
MTAETTLLEIPGGKALFDWFGHMPSFHDAELLEIDLVSKGPSTLRIHTWEMTDKVDARGYFVLDKHVVVTITLEEITRIDLVDFNLPGIILDLEIERVDEGIEFAWGGSYGCDGTLRAKKAYFDLKAGKP